MKSSNITPTKVAIVTGASSGIGLATAKTLAQAGYEVFGFSRRTLSDQPGITFIAVDVRKPDTIAAGVQHVLDARGRISLLVNNAGIFLLGAAEESSTNKRGRSSRRTSLASSKSPTQRYRSCASNGLGASSISARSSASSRRFTWPSMERANTPSKAIPSRSITRCGRWAFARCWWNPASRGQTSARTHSSRITYRRIMIPSAIASPNS
jgi:NAD(P)-dependent dehydrogenase (short-subunit alcohol dehydrogenase family)